MTSWERRGPKFEVLGYIFSASKPGTGQLQRCPKSRLQILYVRNRDGKFVTGIGIGRVLGAFVGYLTEQIYEETCGERLSESVRNLQHVFFLPHSLAHYLEIVKASAQISPMPPLS